MTKDELHAAMRAKGLGVNDLARLTGVIQRKAARWYSGALELPADVEAMIDALPDIHGRPTDGA